MPGRDHANPGVISVMLVPNSSDTGHVGLVGLLRGDVDGSWSPPSGSTRLEEGYFTALVARLEQSAPDAGFTLGQWGVYPD